MKVKIDFIRQVLICLLYFFRNGSLAAYQYQDQQRPQIRPKQFQYQYQFHITFISLDTGKIILAIDDVILGQNIMHHMPMHVRKSIPAALMLEDQLLMVNA